MIKAIRGFKDILPDEIFYWRLLEEEARKVFESFGYREIRIPVVEHLGLFERGIGEQTDVVQKEMYVFKDKSGEFVALRPEATAGVVRAFIEHALYYKDPSPKYYFFGPMFRYERPQAGRLRQFHQLNVEAFGVREPSFDAEILHMLWTLYKKLDILDFVKLEINHLGCEKCRPLYRESLLKYLEEKKDRLCDDCKKRLARNPLRVLDCKNEECKAVVSSVPVVTDYLCDDCRLYFDSLKDYLDVLKVEYINNPLIVRGLDYYTGVVFELTTGMLGAQGAVAAGGRYDNLVAQLGGPDICGIGFAVGAERTVALLKERVNPEGGRIDIFFAVLDESGKRLILPIAGLLREEGFVVEISHEIKSLKSQMRKANKLGARFVFMVGEDEIKKGTVTVRDMFNKKQLELPFKADNLLNFVRGELR